jgi:hypothetical protein
MGFGHQLHNLTLYLWLIFLLQDNLGLKPLFIWGNDKCDVTRSKHPLNPNRKFVLKTLSKVFFDISPSLDFKNKLQVIPY